MSGFTLLITAMGVGVLIVLWKYSRPAWREWTEWTDATNDELAERAEER